MAKAHIVAADGAEVNVDGTPAEIAALLKQLRISPRTVRRGAAAPAGRTARSPKPSRTTVPALLDELVESRFFSKPKGMGEIQTRLADLGHHYPLTSLSGPLQWHVRRRKLRRYKKDRKYVYAQ
jgi:hypothetical protein